MFQVRWQRVSLVLLLCLVGLIAFGIGVVKGGSFADAPDEPWVWPTEIALHNTGPVITTGNERRYDCTQLTYRIAGDISKRMHAGCFVPAAFGMIDPDQSTVIFNGTDEAVTILQSGKPAALGALPYSGSAARFGGFPNAGTYMYLYTDFASALSDRRSLTGTRYKELTSGPNLTVTDTTGQPLAVNPFAMGYAARGQWMVTESPSRALVRVNLATFSVLPFASSFDMPGKPYASHSASMAITEDGRYAAVASNEREEFKVYDLKTCVAVAANNPLATQACRSYDYWSYIKSQVGGTLSGISQVTFIDDGLISFNATSGSTTESYLLSPSGAVASLIPYLGVGDSYASGQGAFNYLNGTDTPTNRCHLSAHSYPLRLSGTLFGNHGRSVACSGARIHDIGSNSANYTGQNKEQRSASDREADGSEVNIIHDFLPGALAQQRFITSYQPGVITIQIGGNDVGFGDILLRCVSPIASLKNLVMNPNSCYQTYEDRLEVAQTIDRTYSRWVQLYRQIRQQSPASTIYAVGYPQILSSKAECRRNVRLTLAEIMFARDLTNYINAVIQKATQAAGVNYVDVSNAFQGYELCSGSPGQLAMNGITAGTDAFGILGQESFHPNAFGHELLERAILAGTHNLAATAKPVSIPGQQQPTVASNEPILQAPPSGRTIQAVTPTKGMVQGNATLGGSLMISIKDPYLGLASSTTYTVRIGGTTDIGTLNSDGAGNLQGSVNVPPQTNPGLQPISVIGVGQGGNPITVVEVIYISDSPGDHDGDGVANGQDSCPIVVNSGIDDDQDGIDDVCDPSVGVTPNTPPTDHPAETPLPLQPAAPPTPSPVSPASTIPSADLPLAGLLTTTKTSSLEGNLIVQNASSIKLAKTPQKGSVLGIRTIKDPFSSRPTPNLAVISPAPLEQFKWYLWLLLVVVLLAAYRLARFSLNRAH